MLAKEAALARQLESSIAGDEVCAGAHCLHLLRWPCPCCSLGLAPAAFVK